MIVRQVQIVVCLAIFLCSNFALAQELQLDPSSEVTNAKIEQLLDQKRDMVFEDATLEQIAAFLEMNGIPTHIEVRALEDFGIGIDTPTITFRQHAIRLRDGVRFILDSTDLVALPRNGRLVITTDEASEQQLITTVYDVRNLVELVPENRGGGFGYNSTVVFRYDFDPLIDTITSAIGPDSWDEVGGPAHIKPFYTRHMRALVVSQTYYHHRQIQALLDKLTALGGSKPLASVAVYSPRKQRSNPIVRSRYRHPTRVKLEIRSSQLRTTGQ